jgi:hypothetical protein
MVNLFTWAEALAIWGTLAEAIKKVIVDSRTGRSIWEVVASSRQYEHSEGIVSDSSVEVQEVIVHPRSGRISKANPNWQCSKSELNLVKYRRTECFGIAGFRGYYAWIVIPWFCRRRKCCNHILVLGTTQIYQNFSTDVMEGPFSSSYGCEGSGRSYKLVCPCRCRGVLLECGLLGTSIVIPWKRLGRTFILLSFSYLDLMF